MRLSKADSSTSVSLSGKSEQGSVLRHRSCGPGAVVGNVFRHSASFTMAGLRSFLPRQGYNDGQCRGILFLRHFKNPLAAPAHGLCHRLVAGRDAHGKSPQLSGGKRPGDRLLSWLGPGGRHSFLFLLQHPPVPGFHHSPHPLGHYHVFPDHLAADQ